MSHQFELFPSTRAAWVDLVWRDLGVDRRREVLTLLIEMATCALVMRNAGSEKEDGNDSR
jgi:hypothetical protein